MSEPTPPKKVKGKVRALAMFKLWLEGRSYQEIAQEFGVCYDVVKAIAYNYDWKDLKAQYYRRLYEVAIDSEAKKYGAKALSILATYIDRLERLVKKDLDLVLQVEHVRELRQIAELLVKEARLSDSRPTAAPTGIVRHEVVLPPGVTHYGVDPPGPNVTLITSDAATEEKVKKDKIALEDIEN